MTPAEKGITEIPSNHSVGKTLERLEEILRSKGVKVFALIDHGGEAEGVGLTMPSTKLLIFGNPKAGTPLMRAAPGSALDLPLKLLVREDSQGKVWLSYNNPEYFEKCHDLPPELMRNIGIIETLARSAAQ